MASTCTRLAAQVRAVPPYSAGDRQVQTLRMLTAAFGSADLVLRRNHSARAQQLAGAIGRVNLLGAELEQGWHDGLPRSALDKLARAGVKYLESAAAATHDPSCIALVAPTRSRLRV